MSEAKRRNERRAYQGRQTMNLYAVLVARGYVSRVDREENTEVLVDLLADLMHHCQAVGIDFESCVNSAENHHYRERDEATE